MSGWGDRIPPKPISCARTDPHPRHTWGTGTCPGIADPDAPPVRVPTTQREEYGTRCADGHITSCTDVLDAAEERGHLDATCRRCNGATTHELVRRFHFSSTDWEAVDA